LRRGLHDNGIVAELTEVERRDQQILRKPCLVLKYGI
jgi:hypothetical protein